MSNICLVEAGYFSHTVDYDSEGNNIGGYDINVGLDDCAYLCDDRVDCAGFVDVHERNGNPVIECYLKYLLVPLQLVSGIKLQLYEKCKLPNSL